MMDERRYLAFLVRLWSVHPNGELLWRASAGNARTGERRAFTALPSLCRLLYEVTHHLQRRKTRLVQWVCATLLLIGVQHTSNLVLARQA